MYEGFNLHAIKFKFKAYLKFNPVSFGKWIHPHKQQSKILSISDASKFLFKPVTSFPFTPYLLILTVDLISNTTHNLETLS